MIRDVSGNPVMHYNDCPDVIDLSGLPNGIYILRYTEDRNRSFCSIKSVCRSLLGFSHLYKVTFITRF